jgi:putative mobilization protein
VGMPFKSSKFGKIFGYEVLQKKFAVTAEKVKRNNLTKRAWQKIVKTMQDINTKEKITRRLKDVDIEVVYRINPEGRLYGISFIDHTNRTVFNG